MCSSTILLIEPGKQWAVTQALASVLSRRNHRYHSNSFRDLRDRRIPGAERYDRGTRYRHKRVVGCCLALIPYCRASSVAPPSGTGGEGRFRREFALATRTSCIPGVRRQRSDEWCRPQSLPDKRARTSRRAPQQRRLARRGLPPLKKLQRVYASVLDEGPLPWTKLCTEQKISHAENWRPDSN